MHPRAKEKLSETADPKDLTIVDFTSNCNNIIRFRYNRQMEKLAKSELACSDVAFSPGVAGLSSDLFRSRISGSSNLILH